MQWTQFKLTAFASKFGVQIVSDEEKNDHKRFEIGQFSFIWNDRNIFKSIKKQKRKKLLKFKKNAIWPSEVMKSIF